MPVQPTYPGVYIPEVLSGARTITGVPMSIAAFIDYFKCGITNYPVKVFNWGDFEREFGGLDIQSEASYAIQQFFLNGGTCAWVIRTISGNFRVASVEIPSAQVKAFVIEAGRFDPETQPNTTNPGEWGNNLRVDIDYPTPASDEYFNLTVYLVENRNGQEEMILSELYPGLSINPADKKFAETVINDENSGSRLVRVKEVGKMRPFQTGTVSGAIAMWAKLTSSSPQLNLDIAGEKGHVKLSAIPGSLREARDLLEIAIRASRPDLKSFAQAAVSIYDNCLRIKAGPSRSCLDILLFSASDQDPTTIKELKLDAKSGAIVNPQRYVFEGGANGKLPDANALIGNPSEKTGIYALDKVDLFNILCIPRTANVGTDPNQMSETESETVIQTASIYCENKRAFFIMDTKAGVNDALGVKNWMEAKACLRSKNSALYFPRIVIADPLNDYRQRSIGASGTLAGIFARTDSDRGVWKAPAGTEAKLINVLKTECSVNDAENGLLNPLAINCLRNFPIYGIVSWGARTLDGSDQAASEWKYIPVRRLALFLEESLYRGINWVVFESNDEQLWAQIRLNVGSFMHDLFIQGAFQGMNPKDAYFVKCDKETTTQTDINNGIVNIWVGFAPLKPAEFVILHIQQMAGKINV